MNTLLNFLKNIYQKVEKNKVFSITLFLCLVIILKIQTSNSVTTKYLGIADTKEITINTSHAVKIKKIHVIPGQAVKKNELLLELERPDLDLKIYELESELKELNAENLFNNEMNAKLKSVRVKSGNEKNNLLSIRIEGINNQLKILKQKKNDLFVFSKIKGVIGSVNVKVGEDASPFMPLVTMHDTSPTMIKGFVHESIHNKTFKGQKVIVSSIANPSKTVDAIVGSVGNRIVEYPQRLKSSEGQLIYGREVIILVPKNNPFLIGEKVLIKSFLETNQHFMSAFANEDSPKQKDRLFEVKTELKTFSPRIEPSGIIYIKELKHNIIISDDTNDEDKAFIYTMDDKGVIDKEILVQDAPKISDMEAITVDEEGFIYITSSLSRSKKGKLPKKRKRLLKIKRENFNFTLVSQVNFYKALKAVAVENSEKKWAKILLNKDLDKIDINIEGMAVLDNTMYFGLKDSYHLKKSHLAIYKVTNLQSLFEYDTIQEGQISLVVHEPFPKNDYFKDEGVSDLSIINNKLFILSSNKEGKDGGRIFKTNFLDSKNKIPELTEIKQFKKMNPEGLTYNSDKNHFVVSFDQGDLNSKISILESY